MNQFVVGDRVVIDRKGMPTHGLTGQIVECQRGFRYRVKLDFNSSRFSGYNFRYRGSSLNLLFHDTYSQEDIESTNKKECVNQMLNDNYRIATVRFINGSNTTDYAFACFDPLNVGDLVVCHASTGYHVAKIVEFYNKEDWHGDDVTREIVCKVDFSAFIERQNVRKEKAALKKRMDELVAANQELILYQAIAEKNPEMAALLETYQNLSSR